KARVAHGAWLPWVREHCRFAERTVQGYMRLARELPKLDGAKAQHVADLPYREAIRALAAREDELESTDPAEGQLPPWKPFLEGEPELRKKTVAQCWDILAPYTILLDALGGDRERIADIMGRPEREIGCILSPCPPVRFDRELKGLNMIEPQTEQSV